MKFARERIDAHNQELRSEHEQRLRGMPLEKSHIEKCIASLTEFQVAIPSWALGTGGTRFGRFPGGGEPGSLEEKLEDIGLLHSLNKSSGAVSLHIPWDIPENYQAIKTLTAQHGLRFDAM